MKTFQRGDVTISNADVLSLYSSWEPPVTIVSDGPYGVRGYEGDPSKPDDLPEIYRPHIEAWSDTATPLTSLWFWCTEIGWATIHPLLFEHGWFYRSCNVWDKGMGHVAGNVNTQTLRMLPIVTEVCVLYVRKPTFVSKGLEFTAQEWLREEWAGTGLPFSEANKACDVKDAATRKYLTKDHNWYFPPPDVFEKLVKYANEYGDPHGKPYFSLDGEEVLTGNQWECLRSKFHCEIGLTNVWREPQLAGVERYADSYGTVHYNQKPLSFMEMLVRLTSDKRDVVWEPFGGLCPVAIASHRLGRKCFSAEVNTEYFDLACERLRDYDEQGVLFSP